MSPFVNGTFFPFTSLLSPRSSFLSPRYRTRNVRSPPTNLVQLQSPILGLKFSVPSSLMSLFGLSPSNQQQQQTVPLNGALLQLLRSFAPNYGNYPNYRPPEHQHLPPNIVLKISPEFRLPHSHDVPHIGNGRPHIDSYHPHPPNHNGPHYHGNPNHYGRPHIHSFCILFSFDFHFHLHLY